MKLTYYGHACFAVKAGGKNVLFDPFITPNELAKHVDINNIKADYILLSHGHGDHVADCAAIAKNNDATVIAAFEVAEWAGKQGIAKTHPMNTGGKRTFDFGMVKCVNAIHSSVMPDGTYGANPMGFVITTEEKNFYYSGDTALTLDMQLIPRWAKLDFAVLCIGDNFTMDYEDAIEAARMVQCTKVVGVHYDTFGYIKIDHEKVKKAFTDAGITLYLPGIGESIDI
ncbi:MAG TPA: metal-dependent hydrolase [Flavisolibacter sp.]|nr:metal-dependent hydrolase [Flavisolibacter sp.]